MAFAIASQSVSRLLRRDLGKRPPMYKRGHQENDPGIEHCLSSSSHVEKAIKKNDPTLLIIIITLSVQSLMQKKFSFLKKIRIFFFKPTICLFWQTKKGGKENNTFCQIRTLT